MAMQRIAILVKPEQNKKLSSLAKEQGVSVGEMHRRAIDRYLATPHQDKEFEALDIMLQALKKSNKAAEKALATALKELTTAINEVQQHKE